MDSSNNSDEAHYHFNSDAPKRKSRRDSPPSECKATKSRKRSISPKSNNTNVCNELVPVNETKPVLVDGFRDWVKHLTGTGNNTVDVAVTPQLRGALDASKLRSTVLNLPNSSGEPRYITITPGSSGEPKQLILRNVVLSKNAGESSQVSLAILTVAWPQSNLITTTAGMSGQPAKLDDLSRLATLANLNLPTSSGKSTPITSVKTLANLETSKGPMSVNVIRTRSKRAMSAVNENHSKKTISPADVNPESSKEAISSVNVNVRRSKRSMLAINGNSKSSKESANAYPRRSKRAMSAANVNSSETLKGSTPRVYIKPYLPSRKRKTPVSVQRESSINVNSSLLSKKSESSENVNVSGPPGESINANPTSSQKPLSLVKISPLGFSNKPMLLVNANPRILKRPIPSTNIIVSGPSNPSAFSNKSILINVNPEILRIRKTSKSSQKPAPSNSNPPIPSNKPILFVNANPGTSKTPLLINVTPSVSTKKPILINVNTSGTLPANMNAPGFVGQTPQPSTPALFVKKCIKTVPKLVPIQMPAMIEKRTSTRRKKPEPLNVKHQTADTPPVTSSAPQDKPILVKPTCVLNSNPVPTIKTEICETTIVATPSTVTQNVVVNPPIVFRQPCVSTIVQQRRRSNETINMDFRRHFLNNPARILEVCWVAGCNEIVFLKGCSNCHLTYCLTHLPKIVHRCVMTNDTSHICRRYGADYASVKIKFLGLSLQSQKVFPTCKCKGNCGVCKFFYNYMKYVTDFGVR